MKRAAYVLVLAVIIGVGFYVTDGSAQMGPGRMGPGYGMGPGMMGPGYGMGPGMMGGGYGGWFCPWCGRQMGPGMMGPGGGYGMGPGMMGPGYGMGPGMMGGGMMGPGMMGGGMMGRGHMGPGMMGRGYGPQQGPQYPQYQQPQEPLTKDDARLILENYLNSMRNPNLKLGEIEDKGNVFEADILTKDDSLVDTVLVDKYTGWMRSIY